MIKGILLFALLMISSNVFAQRPENRMYMAGGYNYQLASGGPLDYVIDRYNQTRSYLTDEMDKVNHMSGVAFSFGFGMGEDVEFLLLEMGLTLGGSGTLSASGPVNGVQQVRDLKVKSFLINTGFAYLIQTEQKFEYGIGLFVDYGSFKVRTRTYNANQTAPDFKDIADQANTLVGLTPTVFLDYNFSETFGITLRPFYRFQIYENDMSYVSKEINPNTYNNDDYESTQGSMLGGFGGEIKAIFYF